MLFFGHFDFLPVPSPVLSSSSFLILHMLSFWTPVLMAPTSIPLGIISLQSKPWVPAPVVNWTFCFSFWNIRSLKSRFALLSEHFPSSLAFPIAMCESSLKHQHRNSWKFFVPYKGPLPPPPTPLYCSLTPAPILSPWQMSSLVLELLSLCFPPFLLSPTQEQMNFCTLSEWGHYST